jgi:hypothetical protein
MVISSESVADAVVAHHGKADAIGELPEFVATTAEDFQSGVVKVAVRSDDATHRVSAQGILKEGKLVPLYGGVEGVSQFKQNVFCGE